MDIFLIIDRLFRLVYACTICDVLNRFEAEGSQD